LPSSLKTGDPVAGTSAAYALDRQSGNALALVATDPRVNALAGHVVTLRHLVTVNPSLSASSCVVPLLGHAELQEHSPDVPWIASLKGSEEDRAELSSIRRDCVRDQPAKVHGSPGAAQPASTAMCSDFDLIGYGGRPTAARRDLGRRLRPADRERDAITPPDQHAAVRHMRRQGGGVLLAFGGGGIGRCPG
jgi:hypothetical protein